MRIVNFGQVVDLDHGGVELANQITVELPDGRRASVTTDEATIQQLIELASGAVRTKAIRQTASAFAGGQEVKSFDEVDVEKELSRESRVSDDDLAAIFGGNGEGDPGELRSEPEPVMGKIAEEKLTAAPTLGGLGSGQPTPVRRPPHVDKDGFALPVPSRTVEQDEMGYPVLDGVQRQAPPPGDDGADDGTQI